MPELPGDELDSLAFGRASKPWIGWVLAAVAVILVAAGLAVSERQARRERPAVVACAEAAATAVRLTERRLASLASYIAPSLDSSSYRTFDGLLEVLSRDADKRLPVVSDARDQCRAVEVWRIHGDEWRAREASLELLAAEIHRLELIRGSGREFYDGYEVIQRLQDELERRQDSL